MFPQVRFKKNRGTKKRPPKWSRVRPWNQKAAADFSKKPSLSNFWRPIFHVVRPKTKPESTKHTTPKQLHPAARARQAEGLGSAMPLPLHILHSNVDASDATFGAQPHGNENNEAHGTPSPRATIFFQKTAADTYAFQSGVRRFGR